MAAAVYNSATDFLFFSQDYASSQPSTYQSDNVIPTHNLSLMHQQEHSLDQTKPSYDSHCSIPPSSPGLSDYYHARHLTFDSPKERAGGPAPRTTSSASPSYLPLTYHHPPSIMASTPGISGQSTNSSADGSPNTLTNHPIAYHDKWDGSLQGLVLEPGFINDDSSGQASYPVNNFDHDRSMNENKYCVGEYQPCSATDSGPTTSSPSCSLPDTSSQEPTFVLSPSSFILGPSVPDRNNSLDSILEEVKSENEAPSRLLSPASTTWPSSTALYSTTPLGSPSAHKVPTSSPLNPTSVTSLCFPNSATSTASAERISGTRFAFDRSMTPLSYHQTQSHFSQDPFFGQSSGRFVAPLESSCSFSYQRNPC